MIRPRDLLRPLLWTRRRFRTDERGWSVALVVAAGGLGALAALAVRSGGLAIQSLAFSSADEPLAVARGLGLPMIVLAPAAGGLAAGLLAWYLRRGKAGGGEGTSEIMEAVSLKGTARLDLARSLKASFGSVLLNATGGSVGREGPIVQIAASAASRLGSALQVPVERRRVLIGCGVAAGMAAAYNAPIGAAMFVMEVVHGNFALEIFGPVVLAAVTSTMVSWGFFGSGPLYPVPAEHAPTLLSLPLFALLGALVAWAGLVLRGAIEASEKTFAKLRLPIWARMALGGAIVGLVAAWIPEVWGNGYDGVREVLSGSIAAKVLLPLALAKIIATAVSLGSGGSGGVFTPALLVGAASGALYGLGIDALFPGLAVSPVFWALGGMSAAIAATTFAPITALIIVFEMCQNYGAVMPLALVTTTATWVARQLRRDSIYTEALRRRGVDFDVAFEQMAIASLRAEDLVRTDPLTVRVDARLREVLDRFSQSRQTAIYVLGIDGRLVGAIDLRDAFQVAGEAALRESLVASDLVRDVARVTPRTPLDEVLRRFSQLELAQLPVVATDDPDQLVGTVARRDVVQALDREVLRRRMVLAQYLGARVPSPEVGSRRSGDLTIREIRPPEGWLGQTLQQADPYGRHGVFVLAIRKETADGPKEISPAPPDLRLEETDAVVLLGPAAALDRLAPEV
ncbi:MAG TPA: chloride channel protein [Candidatus Polarisedimenticolaceae bacterium]